MGFVFSKVKNLHSDDTISFAEHVPAQNYRKFAFIAVIATQMRLADKNIKTHMRFMINDYKLY